MLLRVGRLSIALGALALLGGVGGLLTAVDLPLLTILPVMLVLIGVNLVVRPLFDRGV